jgi:uncharacterized small protein (TIGR04563 family)
MNTRGNNRTQRMVYLPPQMVREIEREAKRHGRTPSWLIRHAWKMARERIRGTQPLGAEPARNTSNPAQKSNP